MVLGSGLMRFRRTISYLALGVVAIILLSAKGSNEPITSAEGCYRNSSTDQSGGYDRVCFYADKNYDQFYRRSAAEAEQKYNSGKWRQFFYGKNTGEPADLAAVLSNYYVHHSKTIMIERDVQFFRYKFIGKIYFDGDRTNENNGAKNPPSYIKED